MATEVSTGNDPSMTSLVGGIIDDAQRLFKQQTELLKADLRKDLKEAKQIGISMVVGGVLAGIGGLLLVLMLVHLLSWATDGQLHLWACHGIVGGVFALAGGAFLYRAQSKIENLNPLPEESAQGLKENLQWKTNPN